MSAIAALIVSLLSSLLPALGNLATPAIDNMISLLVQVIPVAVQEAEDLVAPIQNIIAELQGSSVVTPAQVAALQSASDTLDAALAAVAKDDSLTTTAPAS